MRITSTHQLIICNKAPSPATTPFDSCHSRVPDPLGSNTRMGFRLTNDFVMIHNGEAFVWILDLYKNSVLFSLC